MKRRILTMLAFWLLSPVLAWASWDLFGIGSVATATADIAKTAATTSVYILIIEAVKAALPQLMGFVVLIVSIICATVCLVVAYEALKDLKAVIQTEGGKDATLYQKLQAIAYEVITLPAVMALLAFGLFLAYASYSGISGFIR